jgi:pentatricopeptide repeat protein
MLNCVIAAFSRVGSLARAFETFEAASELDLQPNTDSYNAIMEGLVNHGQPAALPKVIRAGCSADAGCKQMLYGTRARSWGGR